MRGVNYPPRVRDSLVLLACGKSFAPQIPVQHVHGEPVTTLQPLRQRLGDRHAAMFAAGTADGDGHITFPLPAVSGDHHVQQTMVGVEEFLAPGCPNT